MSSSETWPLLSRVADSVYWMARYIERAENVARVIEVNLHLQLDLPLTPANQWQPLIDTSGDTAVFGEKYGQATQSKVISFLTQDTSNPNSIFACLRTARESLRIKLCAGGLALARDHVAGAKLEALRVLKQAQLIRRSDLDVGVGADAKSPVICQILRAIEDAVAKRGLGERTQARDGA